MQKNKFNIAILSIYSFPYGSAPTNRLLAISKGLLENGLGIDIYIPIPTDNPPINNYLPNESQFQGINYCFTSGRYRNKYKILRGISILTRYRKYYGYFSSIKKIINESKTRKYSAIIISTDEIASLFFYGMLAKKIGAKSIFIFDEFPIPIRHKLKKSIPVWKSFLYSKVLKHIDAYISISEELKNYFCVLSFKRTLVLPVIIDISRFDKLKTISHNTLKKKYLCYMGNMELAKDDVDNIIRAFSIISNDYGDLHLFLFGHPSIQARKLLNDLIIFYNLGDRIILKGSVSSFEVPDILANAYILVSSQPDTIRASGGFPTKLGEYLSTGVPALLTNVGENARYVHDGEHIFFSRPQDPEEYARKLKYIIDNYECARKIAENGKIFVQKNFSHIQQGKKLVSFLLSLNNSSM